MRRWARGILAAALIWLGLCTWSLPVCAQESAAAKLGEASGAQDVADGLNQDLRTVLEELGLSISDPQATSAGFTMDAVWQVLADYLTDAIDRPFQMLAGILTVLFLGALLQGIRPPGCQDATAQVFEYVCTLGAVAVLADPLCRCFDGVRGALTQGAEFMLLFVPVFAGVLAASGATGSAISYQVAVIALSDGVLQLITHLLLPLCTMGFAMAIVDAVSPSVSVRGLLDLSRRITTWTLGLLMSVFLGVLSMQNWISGSLDTAATRTTRYLISNAVPVVGGAVSDAYQTVRGSLQVLRSTTGVMGIVALCLLFLPPLLQLVCYRLVVAIGAALAELFGTRRLLRLLQGTGQALAIAFALLVCFGIMFVVATAIVMTIGTGAAG